MNRQHTQTSALELARRESENVAVIYTEDGKTWNSGMWSEARYLDICGAFPFGAEIWFCKINAAELVWTCYQSRAEVMARAVEVIKRFESGDVEQIVAWLLLNRKES